MPSSLRTSPLLAVLRDNPEFRRIWYAQVVSQAGDWLNRVAALTLIGELSGAGRPDATGAVLGLGALFGVELAIRLLPTAFFGPLAGPVADRLPRRMVMVVADLMRALVVLGLLFVRDASHLPLLYTLLLAQMSLGIFFSSAREASVPNTVPRASLHEAYTLSAATWSTMLALGAALGGALVPLVGVRGVFVIDAGTYLFSALLLIGLRLPPPPAQAEPFRWRELIFLTDLRRGLAHVRARGAGAYVAAKSFWGAAGGYLVMLSVAGNLHFAEVAGGAGFAIGLLYTARGLGTGIGPILGRHLWGSTERSLRHQISLGFVIAALFYIAFAFTNGLWLAFSLVLLAHMGGSVIWVASTTRWQRAVDDAYRGRVFALEFLGMTLSFSAGGLLAGWIYDLSGSFSGTVCAVSGLVLVCGAAWTCMTRGEGALEARGGEAQSSRRSSAS